jgi:pectinesterase
MKVSRRRHLLADAVLLATPLTMLGCARSLRREPIFNAIVDVQAPLSGVDNGGTPLYRNVGAALTAAKHASAPLWRILVRAGIYHEKLVIDRPGIELMGEGRERTKLVASHYAGETKPGGGTWGTAGSATLSVRASDTTISNLAVENGYDYLANDAKALDDPTRTPHSQAVAVMLDQGADRVLFHHVDLRGYQDTFFANVGRAFLTNCRIAGNVDFIFGAGQALFERCDILMRPRASQMLHPQGFIVAPSTSMKSPLGFLFRRCRLLREHVSVPTASTALGRPWRPTVNRPDGRYGDPDAVGMAVFSECYMDDHILPEGWVAMGTTAKSGGGRVMVEPETARFFEFKSDGPGAQRSAKRRQLTAELASTLTTAALLGDWVPSAEAGSMSAN